MTPMKRCQSLIAERTINLRDIRRMNLPCPLFLEISPIFPCVSISGRPKRWQDWFSPDRSLSSWSFWGKSGKELKAHPYTEEVKAKKYESIPSFLSFLSCLPPTKSVLTCNSSLWVLKLLVAIENTEAIQSCSDLSKQTSYMYLYRTQTPESMHLSKEIHGLTIQYMFTMFTSLSLNHSSVKNKIM